MALIKCPDCGTDVSDKAPACPKCAHPIAQTSSEHRCIYCKSTNLSYSDDKQGFGVGKALAGEVLFGLPGAIAGAIGQNNRAVHVRCNACLRAFPADKMLLLERTRASWAKGGSAWRMIRIVVALVLLFGACQWLLSR